MVGYNLYDGAVNWYLCRPPTGGALTPASDGMVGRSGRHHQVGASRAPGVAFTDARRFDADAVVWKFDEDPESTRRRSTTQSRPGKARGRIPPTVTGRAQSSNATTVRDPDQTATPDAFRPNQLTWILGSSPANY